MSTPPADGRRETHEVRDSVVLDRTFRAPIDDVWAAITESDRLARWIGSWTGDPASGAVEFRMLFEGDEVAPETFTIHQCEPPRRLVVSSQVSGESRVWHLALRLAEADGVTTLTCSYSVPEAADVGGAGPGWQYYLDKMVAAETGDDPAAIDFDDCHPRLEAAYVAMFGPGAAPPG